MQECTAYDYCPVKGVHTIAALRGSEEYSLLKDGFAPVINELNDLLENRFVQINFCCTNIKTIFSQSIQLC